MCDSPVLPHTSACVERTFSQLNLVKTMQTHCLENQSVAGRPPAKQVITGQNSKQFSWLPAKCVIKNVKKWAMLQKTDR